MEQFGGSVAFRHPNGTTYQVLIHGRLAVPASGLIGSHRRWNSTYFAGSWSRSAKSRGCREFVQCRRVQIVLPNFGFYHQFISYFSYIIQQVNFVFILNYFILLTSLSVLFVKLIFPSFFTSPLVYVIFLCFPTCASFPFFHFIQ